MEIFFYILWLGVNKVSIWVLFFFSFWRPLECGKFLNLCSYKVKRKMSFVFTITLGGRWISEASVTGLRMNIAYSYCIRCLNWFGLEEGGEAWIGEVQILFFTSDTIKIIVELQRPKGPSSGAPYQYRKVKESNYSYQIVTERGFTLKTELVNIFENRTKGAIIRSKSQWYNEGEKNSRYFINLEKGNVSKEQLVNWHRLC